MNSRIKKLLYRSMCIVTMFVFLSQAVSCSVMTEELEVQVVNLCNKNLVGTGVTATDANLIWVEGTQYKGTITLSDGIEKHNVNIKVTCDGQKIMYEFVK